jgi:hypothetical protein
MIPTNRQIIGHQIADLLATITHLRGHLPREQETKLSEVDTSLESTIIRACNRLDSILDNNAIWTVGEDAHKLGLDLAKVQNRIAGLQSELVELQVFAGNFRKQVAMNELLLSPAVSEEEQRIPNPETLFEKEQPKQQPPRKKGKQK